MLRDFMRGLIRLGKHEDVIYTVESECEPDGRWLAEVMELPGVMAYGPTRDSAIRAAGALALRVLADKLEHEETPSDVHFHLEPLAER